MLHGSFSAETILYLLRLYLKLQLRNASRNVENNNGRLNFRLFVFNSRILEDAFPSKTDFRDMI
jgi:hypothetical protein